MPQYFLLSLFKAEILIYYNGGLVLNYKSVLLIQCVWSSQPPKPQCCFFYSINLNSLPSLFADELWMF